MLGVALLVFAGGLLGDRVPADAPFGPDDRGQSAAAERGIDLLADFFEDQVGIPGQEFLRGPDPDFLEFRGGVLSDVGERSNGRFHPGLCGLLCWRLLHVYSLSGVLRLFHTSAGGRSQPGSKPRAVQIAFCWKTDDLVRNRGYCFLPFRRYKIKIRRIQR